MQTEYHEGERILRDDRFRPRWLIIPIHLGLLANRDWVTISLPTGGGELDERGE